MQNLFYVPPHRVQDQHPRTPGIRSVVKRNQPTRLDFGPSHPGYVPGVIDVATAPDVALRPKRSLRRWFGTRLIAWGEALTKTAKYDEGQPA